MSGTDLMLKGAGLAYRTYMEWKFNHLIKKAARHGMTEEELKNSDHRFALFMRMGRAFELCSEREVVDYLSNAMVGGVQVGDADNNPDLAQMAISSLSGVTRTELNIILLMREYRLFISREGEENARGYDPFYIRVRNDLDLDEDEVGAILNGLTRTGLVTPPSTSVGNTATIHGNRLTPLASTLFNYVDYAKRLTQ